jgi:hypothetical protein
MAVVSVGTSLWLGGQSSILSMEPTRRYACDISQYDVDTIFIII